MTQEQAREKLTEAKAKGVAGTELELLRQSLAAEAYATLERDWERCGDPDECEPDPTCARCGAPHSADDLHADGFTGKFICKSCHPAYRQVEEPQLCRQPGCTRPAETEYTAGWRVCRKCLTQMSR